MLSHFKFNAYQVKLNENNQLSGDVNITAHVFLPNRGNTGGRYKLNKLCGFVKDKYVYNCSGSIELNETEWCNRLPTIPRAHGSGSVDTILG